MRLVHNITPDGPVNNVFPLVDGLFSDASGSAGFVCAADVHRQVLVGRPLADGDEPRRAARPP